MGFYLTGECDISAADWKSDKQLYPLECGYQLDRPEEYFFPMDEMGVPMRELPGQLGLTYLPSRIAAYAFANWNRWRALPDEQQYRDQFFLAADWFASRPNARFEHTFPLVGLQPPWLSCIAQGEAISVLTRAYSVTGDSRYRAQAILAAEPFFRSVASGGLQDRLPDGGIFLEEYPGTIYPHVLNGCLYAVVGMNDLIDAGMDDDGRIRGLRDEVAFAIEKNLAGWEVGDWTTYDFRFSAARGSGATANLSTLTYQTVHWILLDHIGCNLARAVLLDTAQRWRNSTNSLHQRLRALGGKVAFRLSHGYRR